MVEIDKIKLTDIKKAEYNPRTISEENYAKLKNSVKNFGLVEPILINLKNNTIISGHQRYDVLTDLILTDGNLAEKEFHLLKYGDLGLILDTDEPTLENEDYEKALNITLNNTNLTGEYNFEKLSSLLEDLEINDFNIELTGFNGLEDIDFDLGDFDWEHEAPQFTDNDYEGMEDNYETDEDLEVNVKEGDLYKLGKHYLLCGDSTNEANVNRLMNGTKAKILFTSPPYNDMRDYHTNEENLDLSNIIKFIQTFKPYTDYQVINLGLQYKDKEVNCYWDKYIEFAKNTGYKLLSWNVWNRGMSGGIGQQMRMFALYHEWIFVFGTEPYDLNKTVPKKEENINKNTPSTQRQKDGSLKWIDAGDTSNPYKKMGTVLDMLYFLGSIDHPAVFPVGLPSAYIQAMTDEGDVVIDCFGGSGTTMIACEQLNRQCYMMELSPKYCQVTINRWEEFTGEKAEKIS